MILVTIQVLVMLFMLIAFILFIGLIFLGLQWVVKKVLTDSDDDDYTSTY